MCACCVTVFPHPSPPHPVSGLAHLQWLLWWPCCHLPPTFWLLSFDFNPGITAPVCTCLAKTLHCLPCALHAWDHAVLYSVLFYVLLEAFLITLNAFLRQLVACWPVYGHFKLNGPWDVPDFPFCKRLWGLRPCLFMFADSSDSLGLPMRMQQCILVESSPHPSINLFTIYFIRAYYVPVTSAGARRSEETYSTSTVRVLPCRGSLVDSKIAYVINHSYYS